MAYSLDSDLLKEFSESELAIITGDPTGLTVDYNRVEFARKNADTTIDTYLWGVYNVPFEDVDIYPLIKKLSIDITIVYLYEIAYKNGEVPNSIVWRRIYALKMLKDLRDRIITMGNIEMSTSPGPSIISNKSGSQKIFSEEVLDKFY